MNAELTPEDWARAEAHLRELRAAHETQIKQSGMAPPIGLTELERIEARFRQGERSRELYQEIIALTG